MVLIDGGGGEDVGKLIDARLNRGLPGRKQGTVRIQVDQFRCFKLAWPEHIHFFNKQ